MKKEETPRKTEKPSAPKKPLSKKTKLILALLLAALLLAGLGVGFYSDTDEIAAFRGEETRFEPSMDAKRRQTLLSMWHKAAKSVLGWAKE